MGICREKIWFFGPPPQTIWFFFGGGVVFEINKSGQLSCGMDLKTFYVASSSQFWIDLDIIDHESKALSFYLAWKIFLVLFLIIFWEPDKVNFPLPKASLTENRGFFFWTFFSFSGTRTTFPASVPEPPFWRVIYPSNGPKFVRNKILFFEEWSF